MIRTFFVLAVFPLCLLALPASADSSAAPASTTPPLSMDSVRPTVLVRVKELEGTGPDLREHRLFTDSDGFITTLDALGRVGYQVQGTALGEGAYHTLFVQLADEYEVINPDGAHTLRRFTDENKPTRLRVRGMIMVRDGQATPLRMLEDPSYYGSRKGNFSPDRDDD